MMNTTPITGYTYNRQAVFSADVSKESFVRKSFTGRLQPGVDNVTISPHGKKRAALAPANPSQADRRIASQATVKETKARQEILMKRQEELLQSEEGKRDLSSHTTVDQGSVSTSSSSYTSLKTAIAAYENASIM